jgi:hypothetical protein
MSAQKDKQGINIRSTYKVRKLIRNKNHVAGRDHFQDLGMDRQEKLQLILEKLGR